MTKRRAALSFENALTKVAGVVGWAEVARICGQAERTVRNWSEPDTTASITLNAALALDVAFFAAGGGDCSPFLMCYAIRVDADKLVACPSREALIACSALAARESGEAVAATLAASHPSASLATIAIAEREIEESITASTAALAALRARRDAYRSGDPEGGP